MDQANSEEENVRKFLPYWARELLKILDEIESRGKIKTQNYSRKG